MSLRNYHVAIVGATGAVGREMVRILEQREFPIESLRLFASTRSTGTSIEFQGKSHKVELTAAEKLKGCDIALFSAGAAVSRELAPAVWARRCVVIDNSSAWRMDPDVPLVIPEVNPEALDYYERKGIIGNPNCSTIQMVMALKPIHDLAVLRRVVVSTYQSASGAGQKGMEELSHQTVATLNMESIEVKHFPHQLAFNLLPHIDQFEIDGYTREEHKMIHETRKIMGLPTLEIYPTCVRVPIFTCHSESILVTTQQAISVKAVREALSAFPGIAVEDDPQTANYPTPLECNGTDPVFVGRIRQLPDDPYAINLWVVADNLRKGAALNAVQIAETMISQYL